jgi:hypothetical protein
MINTIKGLFQVTKYTTNFFLFSASNISLIKLKVAFTVDDFGLQPNSSFMNMLSVFKCLYYLTTILHTWNLKTFEN